MNKAAIQRFAIWARTEMIAQVSQRAYQYGITAEGYGEENAVTVNGRVLSSDEQSQRRGLVAQIRQKGFPQVMDEIAYTWFNRFIALRFMEVNNYLPSHIRVFTDAEGAFKPEMLAEALHLDLPGLDLEKVAGFIEKNQTDDLYRYLLLTQCNALNEALPRMFERMGSYTELLLPNNILRPDGIIGRMIADIPEEDWTDQVQIIGWLYQFYITELNELVYDGNMSKSRISKELLPAATTIYTPDWPIRYMVENSLGRLWVEGHPDVELRSGWKYYLDEAEQEPEVEAQLAAIRAEYSRLRPQDIKVIDPCMGSGHILVYAFDVLVQIYKQTGVSERDAAQSILQNNLYGLDIDDRATQLAYFAVMMKARQYDRRILSRGIQPHLYSTSCFADGAECGSILITDDPGDVLDAGQVSLGDDEQRVRHLLGQKYDVVVTNPPYLGSSRFSPALDKYIKENYADVKSDLCMVVYKQAIQRLCKRNGFAAFITTSSWMFLSSFEKIRDYLNHAASIVNLVDFGTELFDGKVGHNPIVAWVTRTTNLDYLMTAIRLVDYCYSRRDEKEPEFFEERNRYTAKQTDFSIIPGSPVAYWVTNKVMQLFQNEAKIRDYAEPRHGMSTGNNELCLKLWYEVSFEKIFFDAESLIDFDVSGKKYAPYKKGGEYRLWYGNNDYVIAYDEDSRNVMASFSGYRSSSTSYFFKPSINWSDVSASYFGVRLSPKGFAFDGRGASMFCHQQSTYYIASFLTTKLASFFLDILNPTLTYNIENVASLPMIMSEEHKTQVDSIAHQCESISRDDWDSFETSWDFQFHPMVPVYADEPDYAYSVKAFYNAWKQRCQDRFDKLKANEEELNRIFIDIYGLEDELTPEVEDRDVTVRLADLGRDVRSLISYAVGCMFGRYSLDKPGLVYAGGDWNSTFRVEKGHLVDEHGSAITFGGFKLSIAKPPQINIDGAWKNISFAPDADNIIPICDDEYFDDDIVGRFVQWVEVVYGKATLEDNLKFIADALGGKGSPRGVIRSYFLNDFFSDHLKIYQKRPIYWLFDSGKKNGFKALVYMHRYQSDLLARMRTDYVHEQQERYRTQLRHIEDAIADASTSERVKLSKQQAKLQEQALELQKYEEKIHHLADQNIQIDLDDGVKHNYALFADVLAKIK